MVKVTLVCDCCNKGEELCYPLRNGLSKLGYDILYGSRNMHGRKPRDLGLPVDVFGTDLRNCPMVIVELENGTQLVCPAKESMKLLEEVVNAPKND